MPCLDRKKCITASTDMSALISISSLSESSAADSPLAESTVSYNPISAPDSPTHANNIPHHRHVSCHSSLSGLCPRCACSQRPFRLVTVAVCLSSAEDLSACDRMTERAPDSGSGARGGVDGGGDFKPRKSLGQKKRGVFAPCFQF